MKLYLINKYHPEIKEVEVLKFNEKTVWISEKVRKFKDTNWDCYCESFEEAKSLLISIHKEKVNSSQYQLNFANEKLKEAMDL